MITVPKSALTDADDAGAAIAPEVGDTVDLGKAQAKVMSIDGDKYCLEIATVNGEPVTAGGDEDNDAAEDSKEGKKSDDMGTKLMSMAEESDKKQFGC